MCRDVLPAEVQETLAIVWNAAISKSRLMQRILKSSNIFMYRYCFNNYGAVAVAKMQLRYVSNILL